MSGKDYLEKYFTFEWYLNSWNSIREDALFRRILKNSSYLFTSGTISSGLGFLQSIIVGRALGVSNYGLWALIMTYVMFVNQLVDFRVWETVIKYVSEFRVKEDEARAFAMVKLAYWIDFLTGVLAFSVAVLFGPLAAKLLHQPSLPDYVFIIALSPLFATINGTSTAILRVFDRFKWLSFEEVIRSIFSLGLISLIVILGYRLKGVVIAYVITSLFSTIILSSFSIRIIHSKLWYIRKEGRISLLRGRFKEIASFLFHTNISAFWVMITRSFDVLILGHFRSTTEVGYFQLAKNFVTVITMIHDPLYYSIFPEISKMWAEGNVRKFIQFLKRLTFITASVFIPIALCMAFFSGIVIRFTYGREFVPAVTALQIMVWGITLASVFTWVRPTIVTIGKPHISNLIGFIGTLVFLSGSFILVPLFGYIGSAILYIVPRVLGHVIIIWFIFRFMKSSLNSQKT